MGSESLWANCQNFFMVDLPITVIGFVFIRKIFKILFTYSISRWIRKFELWPLMFLLLFDGSIQQFAFYQVADWINMFAFSFFSKTIKVQIVYFGFLLVLLSICLIFLSYGFYDRLNKYIMSNNSNSMPGQTSLIFQIGIKNFFLRIMHSLLRRLPYYSMLSVLLGW